MTMNIKPHLRGRGLLFNLLNCRCTWTTDECAVAAGEGIYDASIWGKTRRHHALLFSEPSARNYRRYMYSQLKKIRSAIRLCEILDFGPMKCLGDIGGVPFFQALVILDFHPHLTAVLTDYDSTSIDALRGVSYFRKLKLDVFDARNDDLSVFKDCDVITMWAVDYALTDAEIAKIISYTHQNKKKLVLASIHSEPGIHSLRYFLSQIAHRIGIAENRQSRMHGFLRSEAYFRDLISSVGAIAEQVQIVEDHKVFIIT